MPDPQTPDEIRRSLPALVGYRWPAPSDSVAAGWGHNGPVSYQQPPYGQPYPGQPYPGQPHPGAGFPGPPRRRRPSAWWWLVPIALFVAAAVIGGLLFWRTLSGALETDATVAVDGIPHQVNVATDGDRLIYVRSGGASPSCTVIDLASGQPINVRDVNATITRSNADGEWRAAHRFDPGSGNLTVTCSGSSGGTAQIGPDLGSGFVGGLLATIGVPLVLGGLGVIVGLVLLVRTISGAPRR